MLRVVNNAQFKPRKSIVRSTEQYSCFGKSWLVDRCNICSLCTYVISWVQEFPRFFFLVEKEDCKLCIVFLRTKLLKSFGFCLSTDFTKYFIDLLFGCEQFSTDVDLGTVGTGVEVVLSLTSNLLYAYQLVYWFLLQSGSMHK